MKRTIGRIALAAAATLAASGQIVITDPIFGSERPVMALPELRGSGEAQGLMAVFNATLHDDLAGAGMLKMAPRTMFPAFVPQQPSDFVPIPPPGRGARSAKLATGGGRWISDWSGPPVNANYLTFGYTAVASGTLQLRGWLYSLAGGSGNPQLLGRIYAGTPDEAGARAVAHQFAGDILALWGVPSLFGTHIYFISDRSGHKEIWAMDPDGLNQRRVTSLNASSREPAVSPDGSKLVFMSDAKPAPGIVVFSVDPPRSLGFHNQHASINLTPSFTQDGKQILYASSGSGGCCQIYLANLDGSGVRPITSGTFLDVEPKVNPKTGSTVVFSSNRSGSEQIYLMNLDGTGIERLTPGTGEASNPSWNPDGQHIAFSWTRGYAAGNWNVFVMDVASRDPLQLTHSGSGNEGRNENPVWAPDGKHLVFMSTRGGSEQIWTMLANGTQVQQLTKEGRNESPVWGK